MKKPSTDAGRLTTYERNDLTFTDSTIERRNRTFKSKTMSKAVPPTLMGRLMYKNRATKILYRW